MFNPPVASAYCCRPTSDRRQYCTFASDEGKGRGRHGRKRCGWERRCGSRWARQRRGESPRGTGGSTNTIAGTTDAVATCVRAGKWIANRSLVHVCANFQNDSKTTPFFSPIVKTRKSLARSCR